MRRLCETPLHLLAPVNSYRSFRAKNNLQICCAIFLLVIVLYENIKYYKWLYLLLKQCYALLICYDCSYFPKPWSPATVFSKWYCLLDRAHSLQRVAKTEKYLRSLPAHHQALLENYHQHLTEIRACIENNYQIIKLIIKDVANMFENVNPTGPAESVCISYLVNRLRMMSLQGRTQNILTFFLFT